MDIPEHTKGKFFCCFFFVCWFLGFYFVVFFLLLYMKHLIGVGLQFQGVCLLTSWQKAQQHIRRHGPGGVLCSSSWASGSKWRLPSTLGIAWAYRTSNSAQNDTLSPTRAYLLRVPQQVCRRIIPRDLWCPFWY